MEMGKMEFLNENEKMKIEMGKMDFETENEIGTSPKTREKFTRLRTL